MTTIKKEDFLEPPYEDDYDENKGYHRILFKNDHVLQAREITQIQTYLQNQIGKIGSNLFKQGAVVVPGGISEPDSVRKLRLSVPSFADEEEFNSLRNTKIKVETDGIERATVLDTRIENGNYYVYYQNERGDQFKEEQNLFIDDTLYSVDTTYVVSRSPARITSIEGDFFFEIDRVGYIVRAKTPQTIIIDPEIDDPDNIGIDIGFVVNDKIVTANLENYPDLFEQGPAGPKEFAPGADRYVIELELSHLLSRETPTNNDNFIFVARYIDNAVVFDVNQDDPSRNYNLINEVLAQRTSEESGDYVIPFVENGFSKERSFNIGKISPIFNEDGSESDQFNVEIKPGVAYVDGHRVELRFSRNLVINKSKKKLEQQPKQVSVSYGNYVRVNSSTAYTIADNYTEVNLYQNTTQIGTANIKHIEKYPDHFRYYLFNIQMNNNRLFRNMTHLGVSTSERSAVIRESGTTTLYETNNNQFIFDAAEDDDIQISKVDIESFERSFVARIDSFSSGRQFSLTSPVGTLPTDITTWFVSDSNNRINTNISVSQVSANTFELSGSVSTPFNVNMILSDTSETEKSKTFTVVSDETVNEQDGIYVLQNTDIIAITSIEGQSVNDFVLNNGQRNSFYDFGSLRYIGSGSPPSSIVVSYEYFTHSANGTSFVASSYSTGRNGESIVDNFQDYESALLFTRPNGETINLLNQIDFRPDKISESEFSSGVIPKNVSVITSSIDYFLQEKATIYIYASTLEEQREPDVGIIYANTEQVDPLFPTNLIPLDVPSLAIYEVVLSPNTQIRQNDNKETGEVIFNRIEAKRWTMSDITDLEARVENIEEAVSLSLLESETVNIEVFDNEDRNRTKSGFFADSFRNIGDEQNGISAFTDTTVEPKSAIINQLLQPPFEITKVPLELSSSEGMIIKNRGMNPIAYIDYDEVLQFSQNQATEDFSINPFLVHTYNGNINLIRNRDDFVEIRREERQRRRSISGQRAETRRNSSENRETTPRPIRSVKIYFDASGLRPNTTVYPYFRGINVSAFTRLESDLRGLSGEALENNLNDFDSFGDTEDIESHPQGSTDLVTDEQGRIFGSMLVPNNADINFEPGTIPFQLVDINKSTLTEDEFFNEDLVTTRAQSFFVATASILTITTTITTTQVVVPTPPTPAPVPRTPTIRGSAPTSPRTTPPRTLPPQTPPPRTVCDPTRRNPPTVPPPRQDARGGPSCFVAGTKVRMHDESTKSIENVQIGDYLLGNNGLINKVIAFDHPPLNGRYLVGINKSAPFMTAEHPVMTTKGWKAYDIEETKKDHPELSDLMIGNLEVGDILVGYKENIKITSLEKHENQPEQQVFNFVLDGNNTYYADDILAHNKGEPLAQTFWVGEGGILLTAVEIFFSRLDNDLNKSAKIEIRPTEGGVPSTNTVLGIATHSRQDNEIVVGGGTLNNIRRSATKFDFDPPVQLSENAWYSFVVAPFGQGSDDDPFFASDHNRIWIAKTYDFHVGSTTQRVRKQPSLGSFFVSQNLSTWTPDQSRDIMFNLYRARRKETSVGGDTNTLGIVRFQNKALPPRLTDVVGRNGDNFLVINYENSGFTRGDLVEFVNVQGEKDVSNTSLNSMIAGATSQTVNNLKFVVDQVDWKETTVLIQTNNGVELSLSSDIVFQDARIIPHLSYSYVAAVSNFSQTPGTTVVPRIRTTTGKSFAGNETSYIRSESKELMNIPVRQYQVASRLNENEHLSGNSSTELEIRINQLESLRDNIIPRVDIVDTSLEVAGHIIDNQVPPSEENVPSGFNTPIRYFSPETNEDSSAASHTTTTISLLQASSGILVIFGAHRPSVADIDVYVKTSLESEELSSWKKLEIETEIRSDENENIFREYRYRYGFTDDTEEFDKFKLKLVMRSSDQSRVPFIRDLRAIASV